MLASVASAKKNRKHRGLLIEMLEWRTLLSGTVYDAVGQFSATANPTGAWSYGFEPTEGGTFTAYGTHAPAGGVDEWNTGTSDTDQLVFNPTASAINFSGTTSLAAGQLGLIPGTSGAYSVVRWTAPAAGVYTVSATFTGIDTTPTDSDVHVLSDNLTIFNSTVASSGAGSNTTCTETIALPLGGTIDFLVGSSSNPSTAATDATGLTATVTSVPNSPIIAQQGFWANQLAPDDDGSTAAVNLGFTLNFFGQQYSQIFVNNNGNVTFGNSLGEYTAGALNSVSTPIIAPYWADVDTEVGPVVNYGTGTVDGHPAFGVEWPGVGYFADSIDKLNTFELILIDRSDTGAGNFDIEFNYAQINWETGDASGGSDGLGGSSARVGYSNGTTDAGTFFELPGSAINGAFLDGNTTTGLINNSINSGGVLGRYVFEARSGTVISSNASATLNAATVTTVAPSYEFSVTYSGPTAINIGSFGSRNLLVTGPDNFSEYATYVGVDTRSNGTPRSASYKIAEPAAGLENGGMYTVTLQASQVKDTSGHFLTTGPIGTFSVNLVSASATLSAPADFVPAAKLYDFDVTYVDPFGISVATLDNHDITVTGPGGYSQAAKKVSASSAQNLSSVTVTYSIQAPTAAGWGAADAGVYTFTLNSNQVANIHRTFITGGVLGSPTLQTIGNLSIAPAGALPYVSDIAIATDSGGNAHIAYIDSLSGAVEYITYSASGHFSPLQIVDPSPGSAQDIAIAVGGLTSYVAYFDSTDGKLKLAVNSGGGWRISVVDSAADVGENPSLAFNALGQLVISYYDGTNDALKLAVRNGAHFTISTVDNSSGVGLVSSIALDPHTHQLAIAYQDATNDDLKLATQSGGSFTTAAILGTEASGQQISLAFTRTGLATLAFYDATGNFADVIQLSGGAWGSVASFPTDSSGSTVSGTQLLLTPGASQTPDDVFVDNDATSLNLGTTATSVQSSTIFSQAGPLAASAMTPGGAIDILTQPTGASYALLLIQPAPTAASTRAGATSTFNENIPGLAEIYGGGDAGLPDSAGQAPVTVTLPANPTVVTFASVTGTISLDSQGGFNDPDGVVTSGSYGTTSSSTTDFGGLSGISAPAVGELVGAFVTNAGPTGAAPADLDFTTIGTNFTSLSPLLNQVFYIGDGHTGDQTGAIQQFTVPAGATKLLLGIPDAFGFNGTPGSYGDNSGNFAAKLLVKTSVPTAGGAAQFKFAGVDKKISYVQTSTAAATTPSIDLSGDPGTYDMNATFDTAVFPSPAVSTATFTTPGSSSLTLNSANSFLSDNWYGSQSALDTAYPDGSYGLAVTTNTAGAKDFSLSLTGDSYPTAPDITNFTALQTADVARPIVVTWAAFTGGTGHDLIQLRVLNPAGTVVYESPPTGTGLLTGMATSGTIPANKLTAGQTYIGEVTFYKVITDDTTTYPGARIGSGYGATTQFYINPVAANSTIAGTFDEVADSVFNNTGAFQLSLNGNAITGTATQSGTLVGTLTGTASGSSFVMYYTNTTTDIGFTFTYTGTISSDGTTLVGAYKNSDNVTDAALTFTRSTTTADFVFGDVNKTVTYVQSSATAPTSPALDLTGDPGLYGFGASVQSGTSSAPAISGATVTPPGGSAVALNASGDKSFVNQWFGSQAAVDAAFPDGTYTLSVTTNDAGTQVFMPSLTGDTNPGPADVTNYTALQSADVTQAITINFTGFTTGTSSDGIGFDVHPVGNNDDIVYSTPGVGGLNGTSTSVTIPANTLTAGQVYVGELGFHKVISLDTTTYAGATVVGIYSSMTDFYINDPSGATPGFTTATIDKERSYVQNSSSAPTTPSADLLGNGGGYGFNASVNPSSTGSISSAAINLPGGTNPLNLTSQNDGLFANQYFTTQAALDAAFPDDVYSLTVDTAAGGIQDFSLSLTGDTYPGAPDITNYTALQSANSAATITINWSGFTGGTTNDPVFFDIYDPSDGNQNVFDDSTPGVLNGTSTSVTVPAGTLQSGHTYIGFVIFGKIDNTDSTTVPGSVVNTAYSSNTTFDITTL